MTVDVPFSFSSTLGSLYLFYSAFFTFLSLNSSAFLKSRFFEGIWQLFPSQQVVTNLSYLSL
ncbi:hypothetical protein Pse7429DRAFT_4198 [Pseudanabaena biceps PCC 7429]|uniref:Uncharacterized protein n=1 Tax=Pseudanabaena biceps PCC 7429 TaxID=927668 RepID=L8MSZ8_9CYAN|nr:hypothetical protein Pse7429DRAFT_4198 [Pseudanabaena biceps PCC 7429]